MENLRSYINSLNPVEQEFFATRCGTSIRYIRKALSVKQRLGESLCINLERESAGFIRCEDLRPDVDWAYIRNSQPVEPNKGDA